MKIKNGISLIVLVITIIIMVILAAAIILSLQEAGIIGNAKEAVAASDLATIKNAKAIIDGELEIAKSKGQNLQGEKPYEEYVKEKLEEQGINADGYEISETDVLKIPTVPNGFTASDVDGENTVTGGLVIYEGTEKVSTDIAAATTRNQYVWIPVKSGWEKGYDWNKGKALTDIKEGTTPPENITKSINKYGGFYIARYEAGLPTGGTASIIDGSQKPVSRKGSTVWNFIPWDSTWNWDATFGDPTKPGCALVANKAYENSSVVTSHLMYGAERDAALKFIEDETHSMTDSSTWGNHSNNAYRTSVSPNNPAKTGAHENWKGKNIYDVAGNVWEWTYETCGGVDGGCRVFRGGIYSDIGSDFSASYRYNYYPVVAFDDIGFRLVLCIK